MNCQKQRATDIAQTAISAGFRAFLAERGTYGFYTDTEGTRVISFQCNGLCDSVSGNYRTDQPHKTGTGWQIADSINDEMMADYFNQSAPHWAVGDAKWQLTTLKQHLDTYQDSSKYCEVQLVA